MRRATPLFVGAALVLCLVLAGCNLSSSPQPDHSLGTAAGGTKSASTSTTTVAGAVGSTPYETQATMQLGLSGDTSNWNVLAARLLPADPDGALETVSEAVLPSAFVTDPNGSSARNTQLLVSATETSTSPETVVYDLSSRAVWSDGTPITAADFIYTWEAQSGRGRYRDKGGKPFTPESTLGYSDISAVRAAPGHPDRVTVTFAHPYSDWQSLFDPILPAHTAQSVGFDRGFTDPVTSLVSGGPFEVQSYQPGVGITLVRNPKWWGPAANVASVDISFVATPPEAVASLQRSQLDASVGTLEASALASAQSTSGLTTSVTGTATYDDLVANERSGPLASRALRVALFATVDRSEVVRAARDAGYESAAPVGNRTQTPGRAGYHDDATSLLSGLAQAAGSDTTATSPAAIQRQVRVALRDGGFETKGRHLRYRGHLVQLSLGVAADTPFAAADEAAVAQACRALHISLTTLPAAPAVEAGRVAAGRYDLAVVAATVAPFPSVLAGVYGTHGPANVTGFSSPAMNALLARVSSRPDGLARTAAVDGVDQLAWTDGVDLPLVFQPSVLTYQNRYVNLTPNPWAGIGWNIASWGILTPT